MILSNEYLYDSILERMPYFSLKRLYYDIATWKDKVSGFDEEYAGVYNNLIAGEFVYEPEENNIYSTIVISDMYIRRDNGLYITNMDETYDFVEYCKLMNSNPIAHPIYTRTLLLDINNKHKGDYQLKYCRPSNIKGWNIIKTYDDGDIERIKEIYPRFDIRYIYNVVMTFGFYSNTMSEYCYTTNNTNDDSILDKIMDIYAFGPNDDNIGKPIMLMNDR